MLHKDLKSTFFSFFIRYDAKKFATYPKNLTFARAKPPPKGLGLPAIPIAKGMVAV
jgi:hypothetical protein